MELYTMAADGSDVRLVASTLTKVPRKPEWGQQWWSNAELTYRRVKSGEEVGDADDAWLGSLALAPPVWSPDGEFLAFLVDQAIPIGTEEPTRFRYGYALFTVRANGSEMTRIAELAGMLYQPNGRKHSTLVLPVWSPDGERLAFEMADGEGERSGVYTVRPDGADLRQETPDWWIPKGVLSPDGTRIAFYLPGDSRNDVPPQLYTVARDGTDRRDLIALDDDGNLAPANPPQETP